MICIQIGKKFVNHLSYYALYRCNGRQYLKNNQQCKSETLHQPLAHSPHARSLAVDVHRD